MESEKSWFRKVYPSIPARVLALCRALQKEGGRVYIVGGAVRDILLGNEPVDWDLGTSLEPLRVLSVFPFAETDGICFGRVRVSGVDIVSLRAEGDYVDRRHPSCVELGVGIEADLARRDFTINAMALDLDKEEIVDPFEGRKDLRRRLIRTVGDAKQRFSEDPLRILRAFRLKAELGFNIVPEATEEARRLAPVISSVSGQRCFGELKRVLLAPGARAVLVELSELEILPVVLPEVFPGSKDDSGTGSRARERRKLRTIAGTLSFCPESLPVRLAALFHLSPEDAWDRASRRFGLASKLVEHVKFLIRGVSLPAEEDPGYLVRKITKEAGFEKLRDLIALETAKSLATKEEPVSPQVLSLMAGLYMNRGYEPESYLKLKVPGDDLAREAGLDKGPELGEAIRYLEEAVLRDPGLNTREALFALIRRWAGERKIHSLDKDDPDEHDFV